ncbi:MAG TPA: GNAT family N-acetyltransferase [Candidatus Limnocylindrales bacterium]
MGPYVRHLIANHRVLVTTIDGDVVAYGAVVDAVRAAQLCDLFVDPGRLGQGLGRPLLTALFEGSTHRTTFASDDPRALPLYARAGMSPRWVCLYLDGASSAIEAQPGLDVESAEPTRIAELERVWTGTFRPVDHAFWATQAEADPFVVSDGAGPVAAGYGRARQVSDARALDRLVVRPDADPVAPALEALRRIGRGGPVHVAMPGPNPLLQALLERRFQVVDRDQYMASSDDIVDPIHMFPNTGLL